MSFAKVLIRIKTLIKTIPQYGCNGGFDTKFITEPREIPGFYQFKLTDALSIQAFTHSIKQINTALKPSRAELVESQ